MSASLLRRLQRGDSVLALRQARTYASAHAAQPQSPARPPQAQAQAQAQAQPQQQPPPPKEQQRKAHPSRNAADWKAWTVDAAQSNQRLDRFLRREARLPQALLERLLRKGLILVNDERKLATDNLRLVAGDVVKLPLHYTLKPVAAARITPANSTVEPHDRELLLGAQLYADDSLLVLNKPYGWATQGGHRVDKHIDGALHIFQKEGQERPKLVHRLDKDATGCLMIARNRATAARMQEYITMPTMLTKTYWAFVVGAPKENSGRVHKPIKRHSSNGHDTMVLAADDEHDDSYKEKHVAAEEDEDGYIISTASASLHHHKIQKRNVFSAVTDFTVLHRVDKQASLLELKTMTGRKHQIRVHCAQALLTPIVGDDKYGGPAAVSPSSLHGILGSDPLRMHLHLRSITLKRWFNNTDDLHVVAPLPSHFVQTLKALGMHESLS